MNKRELLRWSSAGAAALALAMLAGCAEDKPSFHGIDITGAPYAQGFSLKDADGRQRSLADFRGKLVVLFFGYAQCPDVCPTTMTEMVEIKKALGKEGDKLQVVFLTVDPERDTAAVMKAYTQAFDPAFIALIPTPDQLAQTAKDFKVYYKKVEGKTPTSYSMDHSAASYVFDTEGKVRLYERFGTSVNDWVADLRQLLPR